MALLGVGVILLFYAMVFADSEADEIPVGALETVVWFALPMVGFAAAVWAVVEASRALAGLRVGRRYAAAVVAAVIAYVAAEAYVWMLVVGPWSD